ncbi:hypothetical protein Tco_1099079 [Tanacetum coccineum]
MDPWREHPKADILYCEFLIDALDAQAGQSSFHKRCHDQDPPNNRKGENKKKQRKDIGEPSSRSSRRNRSPMVIVQDDTPAMQPQKQVDILIQKHSKPEWFPKKSRLAKRRTTWFDLFLKSDIDKDENHILGPSTVAIAKKYYTTMMWNLNTMFVNSKQQYYQKLGGTVMKEMSLNPDHLNNTCRKVQNHILAFTTMTTLTLWISAQKKSTLLLALSNMLRDTTNKVLRTGSLKDGAKKFVAITLKLLMVYTIGKKT